MFGYDEAPMLDILRRRFFKERDLHLRSRYRHRHQSVQNYPSLTTMPNPLKTYTGKDPHVWAIADFSYRAMMDEFSEIHDQSVIVSGESGAGKTYACKCVMNYLTKLSERQTKLVEDQKDVVLPLRKLESKIRLWLVILFWKL